MILQPINLGPYATFAEIEAGSDWRQHAEQLWAMVCAEPSTDLDRAHAQWLAARRCKAASRQGAEEIAS